MHNVDLILYFLTFNYGLRIGISPLLLYVISIKLPLLNFCYILVDKITNQTARPYLEKNLFPQVRVAMKDLLNHIQTSGELTKYWGAVDKQNDVARKAARREYRNIKRLEMGSEY